MGHAGPAGGRLHESIEHRTRRLARRDHVHGSGVAEDARDAGRGQRARQQRARIHGGQSRAREEVEMLSKERKGVQWTCRGSVHPDAPVTRSNWRRRRLTT
jgi:hypothetical protein